MCCFVVLCKNTGEDLGVLGLPIPGRREHMLIVPVLDIRSETDLRRVSTILTRP